jgi:2-isopropylmalate synthase
MADRVYLYDTTLRDGAQTQGVDFSAADKIAISIALDKLGIDYVEGGWPGANPTDDAVFADPPKLKRAIWTAFGMTRRPGRSPDNDPGLSALINCASPAVCIVGKSWDFQVDVALGIPRSENIEMIGDSIAHLKARGREAQLDAEHFFDGYKANPTYALDCIKAAYEAGARWITLCDTNGGSLPDEVERIVAAAAEVIPGDKLGIHTHNDTENAVANSLAAVRSGARLVQGTLNGLGERCGNANLVALLPTLMLKMGYDTGVSEEGLTHLVSISRLLDERINRAPNRYAAYVGENAFAHKGGLHVSAIEKNPKTYEHVEPEKVGNIRKILVSDQAGRSNILSRCREVGIEVPADDKRIGDLVTLVKEREFDGYAYDGAEASFELLARRLLGEVPDFFTVNSFRVIDERRWNALGKLVTLSEATVRLTVNGEQQMTVADGNGPVNALDEGLRKALIPFYPSLKDIHLTDYKVRILTPQDGTKAVTRVMIESQNGRGERWTTVGVSPNVIDASFNALLDVLCYKLMRDKISPS